MSFSLNSGVYVLLQFSYKIPKISKIHNIMCTITILIFKVEKS